MTIYQQAGASGWVVGALPGDLQEQSLSINVTERVLESLDTSDENIFDFMCGLIYSFS